MDYFIHIGTLMLIYLLLAQSMNLYLGYTGILALSHIAFFGIGAYSTAIITLNGGSHILGLMIGLLISIILGVLLGITSIRLKADYLGIATLGFTQIISSFMQNWDTLTRGPLGLPGIPRPSIFGFLLSEKSSYFVFTLLITAVLMFLMFKIVRSRYGMTLEAIRDDEIAAKSIGINTVKYKLIIFCFGASIASIAGFLYAHFITYIDPVSFHLNELSLILVMTIIGGLGTFRGPFLGVLFITLIFEPLRFIGLPSQYLGALRMMIYSLFFLVTMIYVPAGLGGFMKFKKRNRRKMINY